MILAYSISTDKEIEKREVSVGDEIPENVVWIDLIEPTPEEEKEIEAVLKIDVPTREEMDKMEVMSPFYKEGKSYFMTITAMHKLDKDYPLGTAINFILHPKCLITVRYTRLKAFTYFTNRAMKDSQLISSSEVVLEGLMESMVHSLADALEKVGTEIDHTLINVFEKPAEINSYNKQNKKAQKDTDNENDHYQQGNYYTFLIKRVGIAGNLISKIRESLVSINRIFIFFGQIEESKYLAKKENRTRFRNLMREIHSLNEYANFLTQRNSFLLDATLGMLNVEQNKIIKIFTVAAAVFMPPTLIASVYGMNFVYMPEVAWIYGYPIALALIVLSAVLPYLYFKRKGLL